MKTATVPFHIVGSAHDRPAASRVIYADGAGVGEFRPDVDHELSHWVPNHTDERYVADTSTEICLRYAADSNRPPADLVVNNHADTDGVLSVFALVRSELALAHRETLVDAASMGDFQAWPSRPGFRVAQELALFLYGPDRPVDIGDCYERALDIVSSILTDGHEEPAEVESGWKILEEGHSRLGQDVSVESSGRLVGFTFPEVDAAELEPSLKVPFMNEVVDESVAIWPMCRNRDHAEAVHLVSVPHDGGWFHDLHAPTYCWARTPGRWSLPGLVSTGDSNRWRIERPQLLEAASRLAAAEGGSGRWVAATELTPFEALSGRLFPVVASCVDDVGRPAVSSLAPEVVAQEFSSVW